MTYPPSNPGYPVPQQPAGYGAVAAPSGPNRLPSYLNAGVAVLGLIALLASFAPGRTLSELGATFELPGEGPWMIAALVAGLLAAVSTLPKVKSYAPVVAVLSVLALLLVIAQLFSGGNGVSIGWGLWLAFLVTLVQSALAVAALLFETGTITAPAPRPRYDQYGPYGPPPSGYYGPQPGVPGPPAPGYGAPSPQQPAAPAGYVPAGYGQPDANLDTPPTGFPSFGQQQQQSTQPPQPSPEPPAQSPS